MNINTSIWNKAYRIKILEENGFQVPMTKIYANIVGPTILKDFKDPNKHYMIRPSIKWEDNRSNSMAWYFNSIWPLTYTEFYKFINTHSSQDEDIFGIKGGKYEIGSIIIQEFIAADFYWVYFTRNPLNILYRWTYNIWKEYNDVTKWWTILRKDRLSFLKRLHLTKICTKIEKLFEYPQDVEFAIKWKNLYILQSRDITTGSNLYPEYHKVKSINWMFQNIDNWEFWNIKFFSSSFLSPILQVLIVWNSVFWKPKIKKEALDNKLSPFIKKYKKYLAYKRFSSYLNKLLFFQSFEKNILNEIFKDYKFSFDIYTKSNITKEYTYKWNMKTKILIYVESLKLESFKELEKIKKSLIEKNMYWSDIKYLTYQEYIDSKIDHHAIIYTRKNLTQTSDIQKKYIFIVNGKILWKHLKDFNRVNWIYKWKMSWETVKKVNYSKDKKNIILVLDDLSEDITPYIWNVSWVIALQWSIYSHNAILLRENKVPSYIIW